MTHPSADSLIRSPCLVRAWTPALRPLVCTLALLVVTAACGDTETKPKDPEQGGELEDGGLGDAGPQAPSGPIAEANAEAWTWVDFPETRCMNDSATGLGVKLVEGSDKVLIVIQGGGACFNATTCAIAANPNGFGEAQLAAQVRLGLLDEADETNPFRGWNKVFIPYCSGDIFSGAALDGTGFEGRTQAGYLNMRHYLARLAPTFKDASHVVINGYSAGGFAATVNWTQAIEAFGDGMRIDVLNDSGPPLGEDYLTPCLQQRMAEVWNWEASVPEGCTDCDVAAGHVTEPIVRWSIEQTKAYRHGLISSSEDGIIKVFFGYGLDDCKEIDGLFATFPEGLYPQALRDLDSETFALHPGARSFIIESNKHVWTMSSPGSVESEGVVLSDWLEDFLDADSDWQSVTPF